MDGNQLSAETPQACTADFTAALVGRDIDSALGLLTDDVVFFFSNGTAVAGKDAFSAFMTASWQVMENYKYETLDAIWVAQSEASASVIYSFAWSAVARGAEISGAGRGTRVFRKTPGSGWLIAHEHLSTGQWKP